MLGRAIDSVLAQTFDDFELIIVDDGSTDGTRELVSAYRRQTTGAKLSGLIYIFQNRQNVASARNLGIRRARGEFVAFLDSDDSWRSDKLALQVNYLRSTSAALVHTNRVLTIMPGNRRDAILPLSQHFARNSQQLLAGTGNVAMTVMIRRSILNRVGLFDETLATTQDLDLWLKVARENELGFIDEPLVNSFKMPDSNLASNPAQTCLDRIRVMQRLAEDPHKDVINVNWRLLVARHALRYASLLSQQGCRASAGYWSARAVWEFARCMGSSHFRGRLSRQKLEQVLEP